MEQTQQIQVVNNELQIADELIQQLHEYHEFKKKNDKIEKKFKQSLLEAMKKHGIKSFENDDIKITYIEETEKLVIDNQALKNDGLYDLYLKKTIQKPSVKITYR